MEDHDPVRRGYDELAERYAQELGDELAGKPLDRAMLNVLVEQVADKGPIADLGCGPGHVAEYLARRGAAVIGVDLSPGMIEVARRRAPAIDFRVGDLRQLPLGDGECAGAIAFYSLIHLVAADRPRAYAQIARVLAPGGRVLVGFHVGDEVLHPTDLFGIPIDIDFHFLVTDDVVRGLEQAGLVVEARIEREPYDGVEHPSRRAYVLAHSRGESDAGTFGALADRVGGLGGGA